jgi:hypothetical protein
MVETSATLPTSTWCYQRAELISVMKPRESQKSVMVVFNSGLRQPLLKKAGSRLFSEIVIVSFKSGPMGELTVLTVKFFHWILRGHSTSLQS